MEDGQSALNRTLSPADLYEVVKTGGVLLIDVREPAEFAAERLHGALLFPLSTFDPGMLPENGAKSVILYCGSGKRSADALQRCAAAQVRIAGHLEGGIGAWKRAGLPTVALDPATGRVVDRR